MNDFDIVVLIFTLPSKSSSSSSSMFGSDEGTVDDVAGVAIGSMSIRGCSSWFNSPSGDTLASSLPSAVMGQPVFSNSLHLKLS